MSSPRDAASARRVDILTRVMSGGDIDDILAFIHVKKKGVSLLEWHTKFLTPPAKDALVSGRDRLRQGCLLVRGVAFGLQFGLGFSLQETVG